MLAELLYSFRDTHIVFNVFRYITFRAAYAAVTAFLISLLLGPWVIAQLRTRGVVKHVRAEGPESHTGRTRSSPGSKPHRRHEPSLARGWPVLSLTRSGVSS